jgi:hypothetical protein
MEHLSFTPCWPHKTCHIYRSVILVNRLRFVELTADKTLAGSINTPAEGSWTCFVKYIFVNSSLENNFVEISFLPTGEIDRTRTSNKSEILANTLLEAAISPIRNIAQQKGVDFDFWTFINFVLVSEYWGILLSLGQNQITEYPSSSDFWNSAPNTTSEFSEPVSYDSNYNIFVNATLFNIYSSYLSNTLLPLSDVPPISFEPLSDQNQFRVEPTTFLRSYTCQVMEAKEPFVAFFSVITTVYVFTAGPFHFIVFVAGYLKTRNNKEGRRMTESLADL